MMLIIFCTIVYLFYIIHDLIPTYKSERKSVFWVYVSLFALSYIIHLLILLDVKLPSPSEPLKKLVTFIFELSALN